jgi:hypothetical protein
MADEDSLQDSQRGVTENIQIPQEDATAALVASQGSAAVFQQRACCTLLEIEQDKVIVHKGDRGLLFRLKTRQTTTNTQNNAIFYW